MPLPIFISFLQYPFISLLGREENRAWLSRYPGSGRDEEKKETLVQAVRVAMEEFDQASPPSKPSVLGSDCH